MKTPRSTKLGKAVRLAAADLLEPELHRELGVKRAATVMRRQSRALLDDPHLVVVRRIERGLEAGYLPVSDVILLQPWLVRRGTVDAIREAVLEESLHRCLVALGYRDEDLHHRLIEPVLEMARRL